MAAEAQDTLVVLSYDTEPKEQALLPESHHASALNLDVIFIILSFLPTEVVLRFKTVCRAWAQLISDPSFIRTHCSRPAPITAFFTRQLRQGFRFQTCPKFPSMITSFRSSGFDALSTSHGLVFFYRRKDGLSIVTNLATSHWALIPRHSLHPYSIAYSSALIYDPATSPHFKLSIESNVVNSSNFDCHLKFHIYSSETSSWTISSVYPPAHDIRGLVSTFGLSNCNESKIGGGAVCWLRNNYLMGYEIASNIHWETPLPIPTIRVDDERCVGLYHFVARDGDIHYAYFDYERKKVKILRLEEDKSWVLEGECSTEGLMHSSREFSLVSYDRVRRALIIELGTRDLMALHLSNSRIEFVGKYTRDITCWIKLPHANTLAPFHGGKRDADALSQLLHDEYV